MRIRRKFLQLTKWTYPFQTESKLEKYLPKGYKKDENGNYYLKVGEDPTTMFACHLDTCCVKHQPVKHIHTDQFIKTNGKTILGADDKAGMVVVLYMIEKNIPGLYYFFRGEEVGCVGSSDLADQWAQLTMFNNIKKIISFDRRGTNSVVTHQLYGRCCSDDFAKELSNRLNLTENLQFRPDPTGILTDSAQFTNLVPECTNISVGYYHEHTNEECQDINFLQRLCKSVENVDWETLPVVRDLDADDEIPDYYDEYYGWPSFEQFDFLESNYCFIKKGNKVQKMYVSAQRIEEEIKIIEDWALNQSYSDLTGISWNGNKLYIENNKTLDFVGDRVDLVDMIPDLRFIPIKHLSDKIKTKRVRSSSYML